jgi:hypothetical protein
MAMAGAQVGGGPYLMPALIREALPEDAEGIRQFNSRLEKAGVGFVFPANSSQLMQKQPGAEVPYQVAFVLSDGSAIRGAYVLKTEQVFVDGQDLSVGNYQLPLSEGIVNRKFAMVGVQLIKDALARQPRLYCLGMGSTARPLPRLLAKLGWSVSTVPFLFRIENARSFTKEIRWLRQRAGLRLLLDFARHTGALGGVAGLLRLRRRLFGTGVPATISCTEVPELSEEIDELFFDVRGEYGLMCDRRAAALRARLPASELAGWVVVSISQLCNHTQFGNMKLGCLVDGLALPADVGLLVAEACRRLEQARCDLLVSNQTHPAWIAALQRQGFFRGPSNFILACSPSLAAHRAEVASAHFNRADGDGPINL